MNKISAVIVAKNNPPYLFKTIESIKDVVSEIIIVDIGLNNDIKNELTSLASLRIIELKKEIPYVELIREDIKQYVSNDWLLYLDPDEVITDDLKNLINKNLNKYDYFNIPRKNIIFNKWIRHSRWWPDYQVRLFRKDKVVWPKRIHQQSQTKGSGLTIEPKEELAIVHYNYQNLNEYLEKAIRYAKSEAQELIKDDKTLALDGTIKKSLTEFISRYFAHEGYKDGMHGFVLAIMQMFYYFLVYFYFWEGKKYQDNGQKEIKNIHSFFGRGFFETNFWLIKKNLVSKTESFKLRLINLLMKKN